MPHIYRSAIVPYTQEQMYVLVNDIARYHEFVPYCQGSVVLSATAETVRATLTLAAKGFQQAFTTCNRLAPYHTMEISLVDGPFKQLTGFWRFEDRGSEQSEVILDLEFELSNRLLAMMFGPVFKQVASTLVDAFVRRAREIYA